ncbi:MAG: hypothetical protein JOS17DRAFT_329526 [Linnemannia elongata]|nr:MAG: hypothetical protein JOS17DRAFT_329526 [Linnemannia elongata]
MSVYLSLLGLLPIVSTLCLSLLDFPRSSFPTVPLAYAYAPLSHFDPSFVSLLSLASIFYPLSSPFSFISFLPAHLHCIWPRTCFLRSFLIFLSFFLSSLASFFVFLAVLSLPPATIVTFFLCQDLFVCLPPPSSSSLSLSPSCPIPPKLRQACSSPISFLALLSFTHPFNPLTHSTNS